VEADEGFYLTVNAEAGSIDIARRLAVCGSSVTFPPAFAAAAELFSGQLVAVPLTDPLLIEACAHLVVRARRRLQMPECGLGAGG
jgi:DNA-binding transcriptional LysR family regulator